MHYSYISFPIAEFHGFNMLGKKLIKKTLGFAIHRHTPLTSVTLYGDDSQVHS